MDGYTYTPTPDPTYPLFPIVTILGLVLVSLPAYWHFKSGNVGTSAYIVWCWLGNLMWLANSIAWYGNLHSPPWFWCDLTAAIEVALNTAIPTSALLITHRLYSIATIRQVHISRADSRRTKLYEIALAVGFPVIGVILHVVVQGHRFDLVENVGCLQTTYYTPLAIPFVFGIPIVVNIVSAVYASLAIRAFLKQRKQFSDILASHSSGLTISRYFRLMALAATEIIVSLPTSLTVMALNVKSGLQPWISWEDTHSNFNRYNPIPAIYFEYYPQFWVLVNIERYSIPVGSFIFFIYLGMWGEAGAFYRRQFWRVAGVFGLKPRAEPSPSASWLARPGASAPTHSLPPFVTAISVTSSTKKETDSEYYPEATGSKATSSTDSLPLPPGYEEKAAEAEHQKTEVPSNIA